MKASAIVFQGPRELSVRSLELRDATEQDIEVEVQYSGISTGTERLLWDGSMPAFPGMGYPLVPGYETVGRVVRAGRDAGLAVGQQVFVPGSRTFEGVHNLFGGAGSRLRVASDRALAIRAELGAQATLLALAATAYHAVALGGAQAPEEAPDLIIGHGVMGRLLARLTVAAGGPAPVVWETQTSRQGGAEGYAVVHPDEDTRRDYRAVYDVSGDAAILDRVIPRLVHGGEVVLAGFYNRPLAFDYSAAFLREARIRVAAEWKRPDLLAVNELVERELLSLDGLITHHEPVSHANAAYTTAFGDPQCLKMIMDWSH